MWCTYMYICIYQCVCAESACATAYPGGAAAVGGGADNDAAAAADCLRMLVCVCRAERLHVCGVRGGGGYERGGAGHIYRHMHTYIVGALALFVV